MATITITTTARQDQALQRLTNRYNAEQRTQNPAHVDLTPVQWLRDVILMTALQSYIQQTVRDDGNEVRDAWENAPAAVQAQIRQLLGL